MISKEEAKDLAKLLSTKSISQLSQYEFVLWVSWLDQRTGFREFRIVEVEEDFKVLCAYGARIILDGREFMGSIAAIEVADKYFVSSDSATLDDWRVFAERVVDEEKPRVIPGYSFRKKFALPDSASLFEVYVLSIDKRG